MKVYLNGLPLSYLSVNSKNSKIFYCSFQVRIESKEAFELHFSEKVFRSKIIYKYPKLPRIAILGDGNRI